MLTLNRKTGEAVSLVVPLADGRNIEIALMVTEIRRGEVKIGFDAPREVAISRDELLDQPTAALLSLRSAYDRRCAGE